MVLAHDRVKSIGVYRGRAIVARNARIDVHGKRDVYAAFFHGATQLAVFHAGQVQLHFGMIVVHVTDELDDHGPRGVLEVAYSHGTRSCPTRLARTIDRIGIHTQDSLRLAVEHLARLGQLNRPVPTLEQLHAEHVLERREMPADHRPTDVEVICRSLEAERLGKVHEFYEMVDVHPLFPATTRLRARSPYPLGYATLLRG